MNGIEAIKHARLNPIPVYVQQEEGDYGDYLDRVSNLMYQGKVVDHGSMYSRVHKRKIVGASFNGDTVTVSGNLGDKLIREEKHNCAIICWDQDGTGMIFAQVNGLQQAVRITVDIAQPDAAHLRFLLSLPQHQPDAPQLSS